MYLQHAVDVSVCLQVEPLCIASSLVHHLHRAQHLDDVPLQLRGVLCTLTAVQRSNCNFVCSQKSGYVGLLRGKFSVFLLLSF
jgi:hypothetical protein